MTASSDKSKPAPKPTSTPTTSKPGTGQSGTVKPDGGRPTEPTSD